MDSPVPQTGSLLELQFLRLLAKLERIVIELDVHNQSSPLKVHSYVEALQEQLADLKNSKLSHLSEETLDMYTQRVQLIVQQVGPVTLPPFCRPINQTNMTLDERLKAASSSHPGTPEQSTFSTGLAPAAQPPNGTPPPLALSASAQQTVVRQRKRQEELTDELSAMAGALKAGALAMQEGVQRRGDLLEGAGGALEKSNINARVSAAKAKQQYARSRGSCCLTCMVFTIVALVFTMMVVYIKTTSYLLPRSRTRIIHVTQPPHQEL